MGNWVSHHDEFFTKLRTLKEVESSRLQVWWRQYMLLCKYVLRCMIATMRRTFAIESGSTYYTRLLEEYHLYWRIAPIALSAVWARRRRSPETGSAIQNDALSMALRRKCAALKPSTNRRRECTPTFFKEEWEALRVSKNVRIGDFIVSGDYYYILTKMGQGDNEAARHMKRQQRRDWYRGKASFTGSDDLDHRGSQV